MIDIKITNDNGTKVEAGVMAENPGIAFRIADARK